MFNIGGGEILVISLVALIVLGPQRLPDAARQVGKAMGELRRLSTGFQSELKGALDDTGPAASPAPRDPLGERPAPSPFDEPARAALDAVSGQTPSLPADPKVRTPRRQPLKAAVPAKGTTTTAKSSTKPAAKRTSAAGSGANAKAKTRTNAKANAKATGAAKRSSGGAAPAARRRRAPR